jgi:hypothetical protein
MEDPMKRWFSRKHRQPPPQPGGSKRFKRLPARVDPRDLRTGRRENPPRDPGDPDRDFITRYGDPFDG